MQLFDDLCSRFDVVGIAILGSYLSSVGFPWFRCHFRWTLVSVIICGSSGLSLRVLPPELLLSRLLVSPA